MASRLCSLYKEGIVRGNDRGFSLLETLAAMFLLALCFGALMHAAGASMALGVRSEGYTQASLWASGLLDRTFVADFPAEGLHQGTFDNTYRWTMNVSSPPEDQALQTSTPLHLYQVDLTVEWQEGGRPVRARFVTLRTVSTRPPAQVAPPESGGDS
jgi:general secretion pathway protein I